MATLVNRRDTSLPVMFAWIFGVGFLILSGLWFIQRNEMLLGIFRVDRLLNWFYVVSGILGVIAAISGHYWSRMFMRLVVVVYGILGIWNLFSMRPLGIPMNGADAALHLVLAVIALYPAFYEELSGSPVSPARAGGRL